MYQNKRLPFSWDNIRHPLFFTDEKSFQDNLESDISATLEVASAEEAQRFGLISSALGKRAAQKCLKTLRYYITEDFSSMCEILEQAHNFFCESVDMEFIINMKDGDVFPFRKDEDFIPWVAKQMSEPDEKELFRTLVGQDVFWHGKHPFDEYRNYFTENLAAPSLWRQ